LLHTSPVVHALPSLHAVPFSGVGSLTHPVAGLQLSAVHGLLSLQFFCTTALHVPVVGVFGVLQLDEVLHWSAAWQTTPP
jgi:hypothetical protein